jgi:hypothetical protein
MFVLDCEVYSNYFLFAAKQINGDKTLVVEMHNDKCSDKDRRAVDKAMSSAIGVSFNGNNYDLPIIASFLAGASNADLKTMSDKIIVDQVPSWRLGVRIPKKWDHIDLFEVSFGRASLKIYGGRLGCPKMQDLPIEPSATISEVQAKELRDYCSNDLDVTERLYNALAPQIELRKSMSDQYGIDLRSKSDAQIAEAVIKSEYLKLSGDMAYKPESIASEFYYVAPDLVSFSSKYLSDILTRIHETPFALGKNGSVLLPDWLKSERIVIDNTPYQMGIGGLHSCEKRQFVGADKDHLLFDMDVASYYPNIILEQGLEPESMTGHFINVYESLVDRRIVAKRSGDKVTADTLKICVNGSFGKLGSKYSALYAPELLIQTTITGQLALLMLIERMTDVGIRIMSANTDGIVCHVPIELECAAQQVAFDWMLDTTYVLERTDYRALASRDVNNYVAVKLDGSYKGKGVFADAGLSKNPDMPIIAKAVALYVAKGVAIESTINGCKDVVQFCTIRTVKGGAQWQGDYLGKAVRFYWGNNIMASPISYIKNGNKVPKSDGAIPMMDLPESLPSDIDYPRYIKAAKDLLEDVGLC